MAPDKLRQIIIEDETTTVGEKIAIGEGEGQITVDSRHKLGETFPRHARQVVDNRGATIGKQVNISGGQVNIPGFSGSLKVTPKKPDEKK